MLKNAKGHLVIVMAPTGSGKGTLIKAAQKRFPDLLVTVSCTTRAIRPGEVAGKDYHFITPEAFEEKKQAGEFLEWAQFGNHSYGTLISEIVPPLQAGKTVIAEIDLQGVEQLHALIPKENITTVFIDAGGWEVLKARALARAPMNEAALEHRFARYQVEVAVKDSVDVIVDNKTNDFTIAKEAFCQLIAELHNKT